MAHFLRLKLHAVCSSRLPAIASKLLKSPDLRLTSWRWYGEGVLLEEHGDGGSMAANQEDSLAKGFERGATNRVPALHDFSTDENLESSLGKLSNLICDKSEVNSNIPNVRKGSTNQIQSDRLSAEGTSKSAKDDKWQKMVSSVRSMALKKKLKAGDANNSGSLKAGQIDSQLDFSDLDLPQAEGVSQGPTVSHKEPLALNTFSKSSKQKIAQSQSLYRQISEDSAESFSSGDVHFDCGKKVKQQQHKPKLPEEEVSLDSGGPPDFRKPRNNSSQCEIQHKNKHRSKFHQDLDPASKNEAPEPFFKLPKDSDDALMAAKGGRFFYLEDFDRTSKNEAQEAPFKLPQSSDDAFMSAKGFLSRKMAHQTSSNSDGVSKQTYMVCIHNLPSSCNPSMVKTCMAIHGEVAAVFKKPVRERLSAYIQFKTVEAMESALASRKLQLGSKTCYITRADNSVFTTVVRVSKVGNDTDEGQLRSVCEQFGKVDDVRKRAYGVFDVFYDVKELMNISNILASLSEVNLNRSTWFALPAPLVHPSMQKEVMKSLDGQSWRDIQVNNAINRIEAGLDAVSVLFEDLKQLNSVAREYTK